MITSTDALCRARAALSKSSVRELQQLEILDNQDRIVVRGRVSSYYHKQLAQELIRNELGDLKVEYDLDVE